jgi:hypothetical protein
MLVYMTSVAPSRVVTANNENIDWRGRVGGRVEGRREGRMEGGGNVSV